MKATYFAKIATILLAASAINLGIGLFTPLWAADECVTLQTDKGDYLTAVDGGGHTKNAIHTNSKRVENEEIFQLIDLGNGGVALRTYKRYYVTAVDGGGRTKDAVYTNSTRIDDRETFRAISISGGRLALRTYGGYYVTAVDGGGHTRDALRTDMKEISDWAVFTVNSFPCD